MNGNRTPTTEHRQPIPLTACASLALLLAAGCRRETATVSLLTSLRDLTNVGSFAEAPLGNAAMISTCDQSGGNADWARPRPLGPSGEMELAGLTGPGRVSRIWCTSLNPREWLFYFDGESEPRVRCKGADLVGKAEPFLPPLCDQVSGGSYCFMPFPYRRSLRIVARVDPFTPASRKYYHINYETFPAGVRVESFPRAFSEAERRALEAAREAWRGCGAGLRESIGRCGPARRLDVAPGAEVAWLDRRGSGVLRAMTMKVEPAGPCGAWDRERLLRDLVLVLSWDGADEPSVEAPIGDFFCNAFHERAFASLPLGRVDGVYVCRFPMPFRKGARGAVRNDGRTPAIVEVGCAIDAEGDARGRYFHARWTGANTPGRPFTVLSARGRGHFAGCYLNSFGADGTWSLLEGDESIRVDGESEPSWRGTGLEDYFNGAWYYTGLFDRPLHGLVDKAAMRTGQYRFHLLDRVRFSRRLDVEFEFGFPDGAGANQSKGYMSSVAYWYQSKPVAAGTVLPPAAQRMLPADVFERATVMAQLIELERIGHQAEARERCLAYAERFAGMPEAPVLALRAAAYTEGLDGYAAAEPLYREAARADPAGSAGKQAATLLWLHDSPSNAVLGVQVNGQYSLYLDGAPVGQGDHPLEMRVWPFTLEPGSHEISAEVTPARPDAWFSVALRTAATNLVTDGTWECAQARPAGWPRAFGGDGVAWTNVPRPGAGEMLPRIGAWALAPNAFAGMQSAQQLLRPWGAFGKGKEGVTAYLRKRVVIGAE